MRWDLNRRLIRFGFRPAGNCVCRNNVRQQVLSFFFNPQPVWNVYGRAARRHHQIDIWRACLSPNSPLPLPSSHRPIYYALGNDRHARMPSPNKTQFGRRNKSFINGVISSSGFSSPRIFAVYSVSLPPSLPFSLLCRRAFPFVLFRARAGFVSRYFRVRRGVSGITPGEAILSTWFILYIPRAIVGCKFSTRTTPVIAITLPQPKPRCLHRL